MPEIIKYINSNNQISSLDYECYILDTSLDENYITDFVNKANKENKITLFYGENAENLAKHFGASGIIIDQTMTLSPIKDLTSLRKSLGKNSIIGIITRNRRHEAMLNSELEPDFIIFNIWNDGIEKTTELLNWYNDFFIIQSAIFLKEENIDTSNITADFIIY